MRQIIAIGGGGFSEDPNNLTLEKYILNQVENSSPKVCFLPTASNDSAEYIRCFYNAFTALKCQPSHLLLLDTELSDIEDFLCEQDIIYVGGGNTKEMLRLWRERGVDRSLKRAYENGVILSGLSAGSICWFEEGLTETPYGLFCKINSLALLKGSHCPHYEADSSRSSSYHQLIFEEQMKEGYAIEDGAALHFVNETIFASVNSGKGEKSYIVRRGSDEATNQIVVEVIEEGVMCQKRSQ